MSLLNSVPMMAERAPRLAALDETLNRLEGLSADATHCAARCGRWWRRRRATSPLRPSPRSKDSRSASTPGWARCRRKFRRAERTWTALQVRLDKRKSRMLFVFNLLALLATLMLAWVGFYTQIIVIRHHWARVHGRRNGFAPPPPTPPSPELSHILVLLTTRNPLPPSTTSDEIRPGLAPTDPPRGTPAPLTTPPLPPRTEDHAAIF